MSEPNCPICGSEVDEGRSSDYGERQQYDCPRCGQYEITATAAAMLHARINQDPLVVARASHAVRSMIMTNQWPFIDSTNVDELVNEPLPAIQHQLQNLLDWSKAKAGEAQLSQISLPTLDSLASIVGASDVASVVQLFRWGESEGLFEANEKDRNLRLAPAAWSDPVGAQDKKAEPMADQDEGIERGHCPKCGGDREADIVGDFSETIKFDKQGLVWVLKEYFILKCRGCRTTFVKLTHRYSEDEDYDIDPATGETIITIEPYIEYWPSPIRRERPIWFHKIKDQQLKELMTETYDAVDGDQRILAAIGTRTALDRAMVLLGADGGDNFAQKLKTLKTKDLISDQEKRALEVLTDAGSASAHRSWRPTEAQLLTMLDGIESLLYRMFVLDDALESMKSEVPKRPHRERTPK
ncbi:MAG: DUF4145 domain-containing protein [Rhodospirillaceae bacterium]|nr:DUF4145 domain-containing protein [Rhodospirillaceae bacterium]